MYRVQFANAMNLRLAFFLELLGMMLNNAAWAVMFYFFIEAFGEIGGWTGLDSLALMGISSLGFGIAYTFASGASTFQRLIQEGGLDGFLLRPQNVVAQVLTYTFWPATLGDFFFGLLAVSVYAYLVQPPWVMFFLFLLSALPVAGVFLGVSLIIGAYAFWRPDDRSVMDTLYRLFINPSMYPMGGFSVPMRTVFTVMMPSLLVGGWQVEWLLKGVWYWYPMFWVMAVLWLSAGVAIFYIGLRRYEGAASQ
jgi:ABC-2 type transport system permease protein